MGKHYNLYILETVASLVPGFGAAATAERLGGEDYEVWRDNYKKFQEARTRQQEQNPAGQRHAWARNSAKPKPLSPV